MRFLSNVLATLVGLFLFFMIAFFGLIFIAALFGGDEETVTVNSNSVIELDLSKVELDYAGKINFTDIGQFTAHHDGLIDILNGGMVYPPHWQGHTTITPQSCQQINFMWVALWVCFSSGIGRLFGLFLSVGVQIS